VIVVRILLLYLLRKLKTETMSKIGKPMPNMVLIKPDGETVVESESGLIYSSDSIEKPYQGTVISVGDNMPLEENDTILYGKGSGVPMEIDNEQYLLLRDVQVLLILNKD
jgi:chaperonin GroES